MPDVVVSSVPFRWMSYPVTAVLSVEAVQARLTWVEDMAIAETPVGTDGGDVSTVQMAEADVVPFPVTVRVWLPAVSPL